MKKVSAARLPQPLIEALANAPPDCWLALDCIGEVRIVGTGPDAYSAFEAAKAAGCDHPLLTMSPVQSVKRSRRRIRRGA